MCNLSVAVYERAWDKGWNKGWNEAWNASKTDSLRKEQEKKRRLISNLWGMHMDIPMIAKLAECSEEEATAIVKEIGL